MNKSKVVKVLPYEKVLIKGLISMDIYNGFIPCLEDVSYEVHCLEVELMRITGNCSFEHRCLVEEYIEKLLIREIEKQK